MHTLILPPRYTPDSIALWKAANAAGWKVERLQNWRVPDWLRGEDVVLYGEPLFAAAVAESLSVILLEPPLDWLSRLPQEYRLRDVQFSTLQAARQRPRAAFFKPADDKCFTAQVYQSGAELPGDDILPGDIPVLIADPVDWTVEFRCFVLEGEVKTISPYLRSGKLAQAEDGSWPAGQAEIDEAIRFSERVLDDDRVFLPPGAAFDVGIIDGQGWAVVEVNAAWGSGVYGCDPEQVLHVVRRACVDAAGVTDADRTWVVER